MHFHHFSGISFCYIGYEKLPFYSTYRLCYFIVRKKQRYKPQINNKYFNRRYTMGIAVGIIVASAIITYIFEKNAPDVL